MKNKPYIIPADVVSGRKNIKKYKNRWGTAILLFREIKGSSRFLKHFKVKPVKERILWGLEPKVDKNRQYESMVGGKKVLIVTRCEFGGPQISIFIEELKFLGVKNVIGCGVSGSISKERKKGDFIYVNKTIVTDGTSKMYGYREWKSINADGKMRKLLDSIASSMECNFLPTIGGTVDAIYRETPSLIRRFSNKGIHVVNMEVTPFYAACKKNKMNYVWLGYVSDTLYKDSQWDNWSWDGKMHIETCAKVCLNLA